MDYDSNETQKENVMRAFDFFSQIYCQKFEVGALSDKDSESHDQARALGVYKMLLNIHDETYNTPLSILKSFKIDHAPDKKKNDVHDILWWIALVVSGILCFLYIVGLYFTYYDDP